MFTNRERSRFCDSIPNRRSFSLEVGVADTIAFPLSLLRSNCSAVSSVGISPSSRPFNLSEIVLWESKMESEIPLCPKLLASERWISSSFLGD